MNSDNPGGLINTIVKYLGNALGGPLFIGRSVFLATLSVAETCSWLLSANLVSDFRRLKESILKRSEAEADEKAAEAQKKLHEAAEAANRANLPKRRDALAKAEVAHKKAMAAKTEAEADAIRMDAETKRIAAIEEAKNKLLESITKLRQEGGDVFFDKENINQILSQYFQVSGGSSVGNIPPYNPPNEPRPQIIDSDPLDPQEFDSSVTPTDGSGPIDPLEDPKNPNDTTFEATVERIGEIVNGLTMMVQVSGIDLSGMQSPGVLIIGNAEHEIDGTFQNEDGSYDIVVTNGVDAPTVAVGDSVLLNYEGDLDAPPPPEEDPLPPPEESEF